MALNNNSNNQNLSNKMLDEINQEIEDMQEAERTMLAQGKGLADYDLSVAASTVRKERVAREEADKAAAQSKSFEGIAPVKQQPLAQPAQPQAQQSTATQPTKKSIELKEQVGEAMTKKEATPYEAARQRLQERQAMLTPVLMEKYPEAKDIYDKAGKVAPSERLQYFEDLPDYNLSEEEMIGAFGGGEEGREAMIQFNKDAGLVASELTEEWGDYYSTGGTKEQAGSQNLYGLRSALLTQYFPETPMTREESFKKGAEGFKKATGVEKKGRF